MMNKKAMEITLSTVVIGIILLIVLAVVLFIFGSNIGKQNEIIGNQIKAVNDSSQSPSDNSFIKDLLKNSTIFFLGCLSKRRKKTIVYEKNTR